MKIETVAISSVVPYARNPRKNEAAIAKVAASIKEYGFRQPIVVDEQNVVIAGHTRLAAAQRLGLTEVPVHIADGLSDQQVKAYRIADNRVSQEAQWDTELLKLEFADLAAEGFDLDLTGFDGDEIDKFLAPDGTAGLTDPDDIPDEADSVAVLGDVWTLGRHRLVCGDSTDADVVAKCLNGVTPHLMVTDPPYGVEYDAEWRHRAGANSETAATGRVLNDDRADWREAWSLFPGDVAYVWHAGLHAGEVADSLVACDFVLTSQIVWDKGQLVLSRGDYHWQHEPCWYAVRKNKRHAWEGDRKQTTVWSIAKPRKSETGHSTQKPVECMKRPIENNSSPGQAIYEPFSGSGTTIIAAEMTGRTCHAVELNPAYVDIAVKRWEEFTGEKAELERAEGA